MSYVQLTEADLYNLHSGRGGINKSEVEIMMLGIMIRHMHEDHNMGIRGIAKKTGLKMKEVKKILCKQ
jgi:ribonuclease BN (tRNA processing enzyme)